MRREFPDGPVVGVGAVILDADKVLLVRRGHEPLKGEWSLPGGALELGETLEFGICREVAEETGLSVKALGIVEVLDKIVREPVDSEADRYQVRYHYVLIDFLCEVVGGSLHVASDALDARWISHEELNSHGAYKLAPATVSVIERAFAMKRLGSGSKMFVGLPD